MRSELKCSKKRISLTAGATNLVFDGNSLMYSYMASPGFTLPQQTCAAYPISSAITPINLGIGSTRWTDMTSSHADVDAAWVAGKVNILSVIEGTNQLYNGQTAAETVVLCKAYCDAVLAVHPWKIIHMTIPPASRAAGDGRTIQQMNEVIIEYNALLRTNYKAYGGVGICDLQPPNGPYSFTDYTQTGFQSVSGYFLPHEVVSNNQLHPSDLGYTWIGKQLAAAISRVKG